MALLPGITFSYEERNSYIMYTTINGPFVGWVMGSWSPQFLLPKQPEQQGVLRTALGQPHTGSELSTVKDMAVA